ncbi:hypothetical protein T05_4923 [Trichinella murrelli]|uniref:Uncharacterized protein n=1 Tax=Trichinella murrelli TaxID=144512 RepID=A0A0V0T0M5_9BILA|nr:hypothetical protein T05_4923 [Trichinella murrelli]
MGNLKSPIPAPEVTLRQQPHTSVVDSVAWPDFVGINVPNGRSTLCFVPDPTMENMRHCRYNVCGSTLRPSACSQVCINLVASRLVYSFPRQSLSP